ncbi:MAG: ATP synthase subunit I [Acidobacteria bacterium]|nr:ATP synthase subunit I [Acidobacteriota bacterium]
MLTARDDPAAMERRIFRGMCVAVAVAVLTSMLWWPWRVTTGLLLGGMLSLLNHHWLRTSIAAALGSGHAVPRLGIARFVLRYFVVTSVIIAAYMLDAVSLVATLAGLCSFVAAALLEAFMQIFFIIVHREGH